MTSLPALLGALTAILQAHPLCDRVASVETKEFAPDQFLFKVRAELAGEYHVQMRIYYNRAHIDYAYQLFVDAPLLRWDNRSFEAMTNLAIRVENLSKLYHIGRARQRHDTLRDMISDFRLPILDFGRRPPKSKIQNPMTPSGPCAMFPSRPVLRSAEGSSAARWWA